MPEINIRMKAVRSSDGQAIDPAEQSTLEQVRAAVDHLDVHTGSQVDANTANTLHGKLARIRDVLLSWVPAGIFAAPGDATNGLRVNDRMGGFEALPDQPGAGGVLTFTFTDGAPDLIWVRSVGAISRAEPGTAGSPASTKGVYCAADEPTPITLSGQAVVKVFAPVGATVSVWGFRYL